MPTLVLTVNLGAGDARRIGLDQADATEGKTIDVEPQVADLLLRNGWAVTPENAPEPDSTTVPMVRAPIPVVVVDKDDLPKAPTGTAPPPAHPTPIGVAEGIPPHVASPPPPTGAEPKAPASRASQAPASQAPDLDAMTKDELKAHADAHGIEGVSLAQTKDEMVKAIKKAATGR
jgi:hypothetical protein